MGGAVGIVEMGSREVVQFWRWGERRHGHLEKVNGLKGKVDALIKVILWTGAVVLNGGRMSDEFGRE